MVPYNIIEFLSEKGKKYEACPVPAGLIRGEVGSCYDTCLMACLLHPHLRYVEGLARNPLTGEWILHAWVTDSENKLAFDLTWKAINNETNQEVFIPTDYIGVKMDTKKVIEFVKKTEYKGILANRGKDPELVREILLNI